MTYMKSNESNVIDMDKKSLKKLSKSQLIRLLLKQEENKPKVIVVDDTKPVPKPKHYKPGPPVPTPRKSVKQMVKDYEEKHKYYEPRPPVPTPRKSVKLMVEERKPVPTPRTKIEQIDKALKGYAKSYKISIKNNKNPLTQMQNNRKVTEFDLNNVLSSMKGFKFVETLQVTFEKFIIHEGVQGETATWTETQTNTAYFNSKAQTIINHIEIHGALQMSKQTILNRIAKWISEGSGWTIQSVDNHYLNIVKYKPINGSSYIQLPTELRNSAKGLIKMKNEDNECFRWCHIRHLNPQKKDPQRIKKSDKEHVKKLDYSEIEFPVTIKQFNKIEKNNNININVFGYEEKQPYPIYISKERYEDHMELLLITKDENKHYVLIKDFNKFMFAQTKHEHRKHLCMHCLQCFSSERVLNDHKDNCIQVNGTQAVKMPTKDNNTLKFNNFHKQQPVPFVIYADFEALTEKIQGCQPNNDKSYTEAYQKHTDCGYGYKVVCCYDDKYTKPIQTYRGEHALNGFMEKMLEEVEYCKKIMKKEFNKPLKMTAKDEEKFQKAKECHICDKRYTGKDIRVRDHCHITGKITVGVELYDSRFVEAANPPKEFSARGWRVEVVIRFRVSRQGKGKQRRSTRCVNSSRTRARDPRRARNISFLSRSSNSNTEIWSTFMCVQSLANPTFLRSGTITEECASCYCVEEFNSCYEMAPLCLVATTGDATCDCILLSACGEEM